MITMKGAAVSAKLKEQVEKGLQTLTWVPKLTIIRVGENPDDISYEKGASKKLTSFGLEVESKVFPGDISDEAFKKEFAAINAEASVDGILMLRPLPKQINEQDIEKMIDVALEDAKIAWGVNENLKGYIDTPSVESLLVGIEEQAVQTEPAEN